MSVDVRVLQRMRLAHVVTGIAAALGIVAVGYGVYGLSSLEAIEQTLKAGAVFENPRFGNVSQEAWREGYQTVMAISMSLGFAALLAAYGLFRGKRWAQYVWLALIAIQQFFIVRGLPLDVASWAWLAVSVGIFAFSLFVFRGARQANAAP